MKEREKEIKRKKVHVFKYLWGVKGKGRSSSFQKEVSYIYIYLN